MSTMSHERAERLLPWLVNGSLSSFERAELERHVGGCLRCRVELKEQRALADLVASQRDVHLSSDSACDALFERIDAAASRRARWPRLAAAAALVVALAGTATVILVERSRSSEEAGFITLSEPANATRARIDLIFEPGVTEAEARALVRGIGGSIVAGPSEVGRYTVELDGITAGDETVERTLAALRRDGRVRFAGRTFIGQ